LRRYIAYAAGEILLIFVGITLAIWFSNWNETRHVRAQEAQALADIATNLRVNADVIRGKILEDRKSVASCERVTAALARRDAWSSTLGEELMGCRWWTSPFFNSAAYDSLKAKGTDLIADPALRAQIVNLYEQVYAFLMNDTDKVFWVFHTAVMEPVFNRHVYPVSADEYVPNDYSSLLESPEFGNMLRQKVEIQRISIKDQQRTLAETEKVLRSIDTRLASESP
jgi:hypothetical protein